MLLAAALLATALDVKQFERIEDDYFRAGKYDRVLELANRMLEHPDDPNAPYYLHQRGMAYSQLHDPDAAWQAYEQALPLAEKLGDLELIGLIHRDRAVWIWRYRRDRAAALREFDQALDCGRRAHAWFLVTSALHTSGSMFTWTKDPDFDEALRRFKEALAIARREHTGTAHILRNIGDVYRQTGDAVRAEAVLTEAIDVADRTNVAEVRWIARNEMGMVVAERDPARADSYFRDAIDLVEERRSDFLLEDLRPRAMAGAMMWTDPYDESIHLLLREHRDADAFFVSERERARAFLETLAASRDALAREVPAGFAVKERQILEAIKTTQALLRTNAPDDAKRAQLVRRIEQSESDLTNLRLKLAIEHPSLAHLRYPKLWSVADLQSHLLAPDEALVSIHLGSRASVAWIVTRERLRTVALPAASMIESLAHPALREMRNPFSRSGPALDALSRALQADTIARLAARQHLIVVPDGILNDVPFDALVDSAGRPLVERFATSYAPSASSLAFLRTTRASPPDQRPTLIAVANPQVSAVAPAATRQFDLERMNVIAPLPKTAEEVKRIAAIFGSAARVYEGAHATRSDLRSAGLDGARIIHFATHGLIDEDHPERSGLLLTANPPHDDGLLQVRDIYGLHLSADLVTLSACETALGENVTGEGMIGLTRAFFFAGARSVVASLWDVEDASASRLMQRFYANIRRGDAVDVALQHAKIDLLHGGGPTSAPFFWASFVVSGQARSPIATPERPFTVPLAVALAGVLLIAVWYYRTIVKLRRADDPIGRP